MKINPVFKRETMVSARSMRLILILMAFNGILSVVALLNMYSTIAQARINAEIQYASFLELYVFVAVIEFILLMFIVPAMTAGSISGEREQQTLDLILTTWLTPADVIIGKLASSLSNMLLLALSSFPVLALVFVYGGVTWGDLVLLLLCLFTVALLTGSLGIFCSCVFRKSTISTAVCYVLLLLLTAGTYAVNYFACSIAQGRLGQYTMAETGMAAEPIWEASSGSCLYLLLINPSVTFLNLLNIQTGSGQGTDGVLWWFGPPSVSISHWTLMSMTVQIILAVLLLYISVGILRKKG